MATVTVRGATLAGMAASARLARLGHSVTLVTDGASLGDSARTDSTVIDLPATWKDLFKKSGGHLQTELNRTGLELVEAPPARHHLDGGTFALPTERGAQYYAIRGGFGEGEAAAWRDLLDDLDHVWRAFRRHALEGIEQVSTAEHLEAMWLDRSLAQVTEPLTHLAPIVLGLAETPSAPAVLALPLVVERSFGRWHLVDGDGAVQPASRLIDLLQVRLGERRVTVADRALDPVDIDCSPAGPTTQPRSAEEWLARTPIVGPDGALRASAASPAGPEPWAELGSAALAVYELHERLTGEDCRPTNVNFTLPRLA